MHVPTVVVGGAAVAAATPTGETAPTAMAMMDAPHKFDPLHIEDPLQPGNNVGRNVFRIHQIQRAFVDAATILAAEAGASSSSLGRVIKFVPAALDASASASADETDV